MNRNPPRSMLLLALALVLGGCAAGPVVTMEEADPSPWVVDEFVLDVESPPSVLAPGPQDTREYVYRLGPGDIIDVNVWGDEALSGEFRIGPDGRITMPLFGGIELGGLTRAEAVEHIAEVLKAHYHDPKVAVIVTEFNNNNVFLLGAFTMPGEYKLESQASLLQALSMAQGFRTDADRTGLSITRGSDMVYQINLDDLLLGGDMSLNVRLKPGDVIFLPENTNRVVHVLGEVFSPGLVPVGRGLDLLRSIAGAGGLTEDAVASEVRVIRRLDGKVRILTVDLEQIWEQGAVVANVPLLPEDIVYVPEKGLATLNYVLRQLSPSFSTVFAINELQDIVEGED